MSHLLDHSPPHTRQLDLLPTPHPDELGWKALEAKAEAAEEANAPPAPPPEEKGPLQSVADAFKRAPEKPPPSIDAVVKASSEEGALGTIPHP